MENKFYAFSQSYVGFCKQFIISNDTVSIMNNTY